MALATDRRPAPIVARVRIAVRAGGAVIYRDGSGSGHGKAATPGEAHESALKGAETDATKRALATFGNQFGLALYRPGAARRQGQAICQKHWRRPWTDVLDRPVLTRQAGQHPQ